jgi:hypothetical protein
MAKVSQSTLEVQREYLSVQEAGRLTGLSPWTWRAWAYRGKVASVKLGTTQRARLLIPLSEIDRVIKDSLRPRLDAQ